MGSDNDCGCNLTQACDCNTTQVSTNWNPPALEASSRISDADRLSEGAKVLPTNVALPNTGRPRPSPPPPPRGIGRIRYHQPHGAR